MTGFQVLMDSFRQFWMSVVLSDRVYYYDFTGEYQDLNLLANLFLSIGSVCEKLDRSPPATSKPWDPLLLIGHCP